MLYSFKPKGKDKIMETSDHHNEYQINIKENLINCTEPLAMELNPCSICHRTFIPQTLEKHVKICEKWASTKRKVFDSSRQRREGTELASYLPPAPQCAAISPKQLNSNGSLIHRNEIKSESKNETCNTPLLQSTKADNKKPGFISEPLYRRGYSTTTSNSRFPERKSLSPSTQPNIANIAEIKARAEAKRHMAPISEQCPSCGRYFGLKSFDRHVEFCKEKSKIEQFKGNCTSQAKNRLEARTKYKAPNLRLKRAAIRDKYSGSVDDGNEHFFSMSNSLSSSFMSDGGFSDKYDPFLSAKRQLEELWSPNLSTQPKYSQRTTLTPLKPDSENHGNNDNLSKQAVNSTILSPSSSYIGPPLSTAKSPVKALCSVKSNFKRTSSLRCTRPSRPIFVSPTILRPSTIQRGISDEGPISTNFIKPEEYDEMPVKSSCINNFAITGSSKRDPSPKPRFLSNHSRENSPNVESHSNDAPSLVIRRNTSSNLNRRNERLFNKENESAVQKTDSLAVFLKYENDLLKGAGNTNKNSILDKTAINALTDSTSPTPVSEKDLKDKTNILSKKNSLKTSSTDINVEKGNGLKLNKQKDQRTGAIDITEERPKTTKTYSAVHKIVPIKLEPISTLEHLIIDDKMLGLSSSNELNKKIIRKYDKNDVVLKKHEHSSKDSINYIDPHLINEYDNLNIPYSNTKKNEIPKLCTFKEQNKVKTNLYEESQNNNMFCENKDQLKQITESPHNRNSLVSEKGSNKLLKRQIRLGKNQFLYDASPSDNESNPSSKEMHEDLNKNVDSYSNNQYHKETYTSPPKPIHQPNNIFSTLTSDGCEKHLDSLLSGCGDNMFENFSFEEFLQTFESNNINNDDVLSGIKNCKQFLINRCLNDHLNKNEKSNAISFSKLEKNIFYDSVSSPKTEAEENIENQIRSQTENNEHEIFISIETDQNEENDESLNVNECPNIALMKNPRIEEVNANDNKFTKIESFHLPIFEEDKDNTLENFEIKTIPRKETNNFSKIFDSDDKSSVDSFSMDRKNVMSKASLDSAYDCQVEFKNFSVSKNPSASFNTKSWKQSNPKMDIFSKRDFESNLSSNESENLDGTSTLSPTILSKFCYECGSKFMITTAKFCPECGVKRLAIE